MGDNRINKDELLSLLQEFDLKLQREITVVGVGGTAMTLLGIKKDTKDVDFDIPFTDDYEEFNRVMNIIKPKVRIDVFESDAILSEILPSDYLKIAIKYTTTKFSKINLYALNPIDIICAKIARLSETDIKDIKTCIKYYNITKSQIEERAMQYGHAGSDQLYYDNLQVALDVLF